MTPMEKLGSMCVRLFSGRHGTAGVNLGVLFRREYALTGASNPFLFQKGINCLPAWIDGQKQNFIQQMLFCYE